MAPAAAPVNPADIGPIELPGDAFTPPPMPDEMIPELGAARDAQAQSAALQQLRAAKHELRHARNETPGNGHRRADIRDAKQDVRAAKANLAATQSNGAVNDGVADKFTHAIHRADVTDAGGVPPGMAKVSHGNGLALGHQKQAISQLHPQGAENGYDNAQMNCAPTAVAMVARGLHGATLDGIPVSAMSDAELINRLGAHGQTDINGTSPNGVIAMAEDLGMATKTWGGGFNQIQTDAVLGAGGSVIANGGYVGPDGNPFGHFVTLTAKTQEGSYLVNDPLIGQTLVWTPAQLNAFLKGNPANGGVSIGVLPG
ncbi:MAG TPA: hypothetical protein VND93_22535 [Myxococcales bacterium]|nr:hypothetical protein [Myxococcales bacterium]